MKMVRMWAASAAAVLGLLSSLVGMAAAAEPPAPTIFWTGAGGNALWSDTRNWTPERVPTAADHVAIAGNSNGFTVVLNVSASVGSFALGLDSGSITQRVQINSGISLSVSTNSVVRRLGELILPNGDGPALAGAGLLEIRGLLDWTGGRLWGAYYVAPGGRALLRGGNYMRLTSGNDAAPAVFTNAGTVTWLGGERLYAYNSSQIINLGRWEFAADGLGHGYCCSGAGATFVNRGTLVKTSGADVTSMESLNLLNEGTVAAETGVLRFAGFGSEWRAGGQIAGAGRVRLANGGSTLAGRTTLNGILEWSSENLDITGQGEFAGPAPLEWNAGTLAGTLTVATNGVVNLRGGQYMRVTSGNDATPAVLTNRGVVTWHGGERLYVYRSSQIHNEGEWRLAADGVAFSHCCAGGWGIFHNRGLLAKTAGTNTTSSSSMTVRNYGVVSAATGVLQINDSSVWEHGGQISGTGQVLLNDGGVTLNGTTTLNGSWQWQGMNVYGTGVISGPIPLVWRSGRVLGNLTVNPGAKLEFTGESYPLLGSDNDASPAVLTNRGTVTWNGNNGLHARRNGQIYNYGQWRLTADGTALLHECCGTPPTFHNYGTLTKSGGAGETIFGNSFTEQRGVIDVSVGTLRFNAATTWHDGNQVSGAGRVLQNNGSVTLNGTTTLNGSWQWQGMNVYGTGVISGPIPLVWRSGRVLGSLTVDPGAQLEFTGESYPLLGSDSDASPAVLTNRGTVTWNGVSGLHARRNGQVYNYGQWRLAADGTAFLHECCGTPPTFHNYGTLAKSGGAGETIFGASFTEQRGVINISVGTLRFDSATTWHDGNQVSGAGRVLQNNGSATLNGTTTLNASWQWLGPQVYGTGAISGPIPLVWRSGRVWGSLTVNPGSQLDFTGEHFPLLGTDDNGSPAVLTNRGTVTWNGGWGLHSRRGGQVYNYGQWRLTADGTAFSHECCGDWPTFHNYGTLAKSGGAGDTAFGNSVTEQRGVINVGVGTLRFDAATTWHHGNQIAGSGRVLQQNGSATLRGTTTLNASWQWLGPQVFGTGAISGPIPLVWRSGRVWGSLTINPGSQMDLSGEHYPLLGTDDNGSPAVLTNRGTVTWNGGTGLHSRRGGQVYNYGQWRLNGSGTALSHECCGNWPEFRNFGDLLKLGPQEINFINTVVHNHGRISAIAGELSINSPLAASGEFYFPLSGSVAGTDYGSIWVSGAYSHSAAVRVVATNDFVPAIGDFFDLVRGNNMRGNFASLTLPTLSADNGWTVDYSPILARLRVTDACLAGGLTGWWEGEGNVDNQAGGAAGFLGNEAGYGPGLVGRAFALDGVNDYVHLGDWKPGTRWTLQAWVKLGSIQANRRAILGGLDNCRDWALTATDGFLGVTYRPPGGCTATLVNTDRAQTNVWYHLAGTYDGLSVALYLNGALINTMPAEVDYVAAPGLGIGGATYNPNAENLHGWVDEATIHNRPLAGPEIAGVFNNGAAGRCAQLGLGIIAFTPQGLVTTDVTNFAVRFNQSFRTNTFTTADLAITGPDGPVSNAGLVISPVTPFDGRSFNISLPRLTTEGPYSVTIGPGIETLGNLPMPVPYTATFNLDKAAPRVIAFTPASPALDQVTAITATFSEAMSGASAQASDLTITGPGGPMVTGVTQLASNHFRFTLSRPLAQGTHRVVLANLSDLAGNLMTPYTNELSVANPDLVPSVLSSPALALAGQPAPFVYAVTNAGNALAPGGWRAEFGLAFDASGSNAIALGSAPITNVIPAAGMLVLTQLVVMPPGLSGTRFLGVRLDVLDQLVESDETNNITWAATGTIVSAPDLVVSNLVAPSTMTLGGQLTVSWTRRNAGSAATFAAGQDRVFLGTSPTSLSGARLLDSVTGELLAAGAEATRTRTVTIPLETALPAGDYFLLVAVDSPDAQAESNEANNLAVQPITLTQPALPDLAVADFAVTARLLPGATHEFRWGVSNAGPMSLTNTLWIERLAFSNAVVGLIPIAEFTFTNTVPAGGSLTRTQFVVFPDDLPALPGWLSVSVDHFDALVEVSEANNSARSDAPVPVSARLRLTLAEPELTEGTNTLLATVQRNDSADTPVTITITNNQPRLRLTNVVMLPAGVASASFPIALPENGIIDGTRIAHLGAVASNYLSDLALLTLRDDSQPALTLNLATNHVREGLTVAATVSRGVTSTQPLVVLLSAEDPRSLTTPFSVTIPANQASFTFAVLANDDSLLNGTRTNALRAASLGYEGTQATLLVADDDLPVVTLDASPGSVPEDAGAQAARLVVQLSAPAPRNLVLELVSLDPAHARVTDTLVIPAGQTQAAAAIEVIDNPVTGAASITVAFRGYVRESGGGPRIAESSTAALVIVDDERPTLRLTLDRDLVAEGLAPAAAGTVTRSGPTTGPLVVQLSSRIPTEIAVPASVTIPAGQASVTFPVTSLQDNVTDGAQRVVLSATAAGFANGFAEITVSDQDLPDLRVVRISGPASGQAESSFTVSYRVENQGRTSFNTNLVTKVYLRADPLAFGGILVGSYTLPTPLPAGQFFEQSLQGRFPDRVGRYHLVVQTDTENHVVETLEDNNLLVSDPIELLAPWTATVATTVEQAPSGTPIPLTGRATRSGGQPQANTLVSIHVTTRGMKRTIAAFSDASGNFATTFTPLPNEAGVYELAAGHPGVESFSAQDTFTLLGFTFNPATPRFELKEGQSVSGTLTLSNLSTIPLTGLSASVVSKPDGWNTTLSLASASLPADDANTLSFTVIPNSTGVGTIVLRVTSTEGVTNHAVLTVAVEPLRPRLVADPGSLFVGMVRGQQTIVNVSLVNLGGAATGPLNVSLPDLPWLRVASPNPAPALTPGETNILTLLLSPPGDLELIPYDGAFLVTAGNAAVSVPFQFRALSEAKGDLQVTVVDEFTYYAEGAPNVTNATVTLRDVVTHAFITNLVTGAAGTVRFPELPEGYYEVQVEAEAHTSFRGNTFVAAGRTNDFETFISRSLVEYVWSVVPTEIEDRTRIVIETIFETVVPVPVITMEPAYIDLSELPEPEAQVEVRITNHGLIAAQAVALELPVGGPVTFETVATELGTLLAQSSITVPIRIRVPTGTSGPSLADGPGLAAGSSRDQCYYYIRERHLLPCGKRTNVYYTTTTIRDPKANCGGSGGGGGGGGGGGPVFNGGPLSPYGVGAGGGYGVFVAPRTIKQKEECGCEGFVPRCLEAGASVTGLGADLGGVAVALKTSASGKVCSCCDDDGPGWKTEYSVSGEGSASISVPLTTPDPEINVEQNGFKFVGAMHLGGLVASFTPKLTGQFQHTEDCHGKNPKDCLNISGSAEAEISSTLGPEVKVYEGNRLVGGMSATAKVSIKSAFTYQRTECNGETSSQICLGPLTAAFTISGTLGKAELSTAYSQDLLPQDCSPNLAETPNQASAIAMRRQIEAALLKATDRFAEELRRKKNGPPSTPPRHSNGPALAAASGPALASGDGICARVKLKIEQDLVMARQAFDATLELINRDPATPLENIGVNVQVFDIEGHDVTDRFGLRPPTVSGLGSVGGNGRLAASSTGRASFILVPTSEAAPEGPTVYFVGGTLQYQLGSRRVGIPLTAAPITVYPDPRLKIQYFHQRDVFSDDPFTRDVIEPTVPYSLAVMVNNHGKGDARKVRIISGQPQIIENERGLLIDFKIIATEVFKGSGVSALSPALTADFGAIPAGNTAIGRWLMTSTLQGLFINYSATFEHLDSLGKTNLSLIDEVTIHEMNRLVWADGAFEDGKPDFLVNDDRDPDDMPDRLYLSNGTTNRVTAVRAAAYDAAPTAGDLTVELTASVPRGWTYLRVPDPANGAFQLVRVVRNDGRPVAVNTNAWVTDRTFIGRSQRPIRENVLHLLDFDSTGSYTLTYGPLPDNDITAPASQVASLPAFSSPDIPVSWSGTDAGRGIATYDIFVAENRGPFLPWLQGAQQTAAIYRGTPGKRYEFYSIASDNAGNREAPPLYADAQTVVALSNAAPTLVLSAPAAIDEGETLVITALATEPDAPTQSLLFTLLAAPPGATINPINGRIDWPTGEGTGPSTNLFRVVARDNGLPPLSATSTVSVIVREVNRAPAFRPVPNRTINEGFTLFVTNTATDTDLPVQMLTYSLGSGTPAGATIHPSSGLFRWRPTDLQGGTTNRIVVIARDNGTPSLSATQQFTVIVRDTVGDLFVSLGRTNVFRGESGAVPVFVNAGVELAHLSFALDQPVTALSSLSLLPLAPELGSATLTPETATRSQLTFTPQAGETFQGDLTLAALRFLAPAAGPTVAVPLQPRLIEARRPDNTLLTNSRWQDGRVLVVSDQPFLDAHAPTNGTRRLTLYGRPGRAYEILAANAITGPWTRVAQVSLTGRFQVIELPAGSTEVFYRAAELGSGGPMLTLDRSHPEPLSLTGEPGRTYVIESSPVLGPGANWRNILTVPLTNATQRLPVQLRPNGTEFWRAREQ